MKKIHTPTVNLRYWVLMSLACIFGAQTGTFFANIFKLVVSSESLIGQLFSQLGPTSLMIIHLFCFLLIEKKVSKPTEFFYWNNIIVIRAAANNIANEFSQKYADHLNALIFGIALLHLLLALRWQRLRPRPIEVPFLPDTPNSYWLTIWISTILGTLLGNFIALNIGYGETALIFSCLMLLLVYFGYRDFLVFTAMYWGGILIARIAGTAIGHWSIGVFEIGHGGLTVQHAAMICVVIFITVNRVWKPKQQITPK